MMFHKLQNIDSAFKHIKRFSLLFLAGCTALSVYSLYSARRIVMRSEQKLYVLANGKVLEALASDRKDNIPVEAKDHIKMFHYYFFSLDPDEKVIHSNIAKALYLADRSARDQYNNLKENAYYSGMIAGNISQELETDSVFINTEQYPFYFRYLGRQKIIRPSSIVTRKLITEGYLRNVTRSDNNPHGFLIEKWRTIENKDLITEKRSL